MGKLISVGGSELILTCCTECGVRYGIDSMYWECSLREQEGGCEPPEGEDQNEQGWFCCPNGHKQRFARARTEQLGEDLARIKGDLERSEHEVVELKRRLKELEGSSAPSPRVARKKKHHVD